jgi:NAD(P)-dependent dehydrogenase (short-subunit alcohol dehydrogenase family)
MSDAEQEARGVPEVDGSPLAGRAAVVTGASSGIGQATARALAASGVWVGLAARRVERLAELEKEIAQSGEALALPDRINVNEVLFRPTDQRDW